MIFSDINSRPSLLFLFSPPEDLKPVAARDLSLLHLSRELQPETAVSSKSHCGSIAAPRQKVKKKGGGCFCGLMRAFGRAVRRAFRKGRVKKVIHLSWSSRLLLHKHGYIHNKHTVCIPCWLPMVSWCSEHIQHIFLFEGLHCGWEDQGWNLTCREHHLHESCCICSEEWRCWSVSHHPVIHINCSSLIKHSLHLTLDCCYLHLLTLYQRDLYQTPYLRIFKHVPFAQWTAVLSKASRWYSYPSYQKDSWKWVVMLLWKYVEVAHNPFGDSYCMMILLFLFLV